jgi:hypothetical protein
MRIVIKTKSGNFAAPVPTSIEEVLEEAKCMAGVREDEYLETVDIYGKTSIPAAAPLTAQDYAAAASSLNANPNVKTSLNRISVKFAAGRTWKRQMLIEKAVRLELTGNCSEEQISKHLGISIHSLRQVKRTPSYVGKRIAISTGVIASMDADVAITRDTMMSELKEMIPASLMVLRNSLLAGANPLASLGEKKLAVSIGQDFLDREGTLAKVSRSSLTFQDPKNLDQYDVTGANLLAILTANSNSTKQASPEDCGMAEFNVSGSLTREETQALEDEIDEAGEALMLNMHEKINPKQAIN